jgi:hypothetical protein
MPATGKRRLPVPSGLPVHCVVRVSPAGSVGGRRFAGALGAGGRPDVLVARGQVSLVRLQRIRSSSSLPAASPPVKEGSHPREWRRLRKLHHTAYKWSTRIRSTVDEGVVADAAGNPGGPAGR